MENNTIHRWSPQLVIFVFALITLACGVSISPQEVQVFTAGNASTMPVAPTPKLIPTATLPLPLATATPNATADVIEASAVDGTSTEPEPQPAVPQAPPDNFQSVSISDIVDTDTVEVLIDGVPYQLPYATLPPPPSLPAQTQTAPSITPQWDARLSELGVTLTRARPELGQTVFRLVEAQFLDEQQADGLHHIYVEVLDESGQRLLEQPVIQQWRDGRVIGYTENKPPPEFALNFPIYGVQGSDNYEVFVEGAPSDVVSGLGLPGGRLTAYQLTFQRQQN